MSETGLDRIANPKTHYGKGGTRHFIWQRISGALNVLFLVFFVWFIVRIAGTARAEMLDLVRNPFVAIILALLIVNVAVHMRIGMNEVIEDYLDDERVNHLARLANTAFAIFVVVLTLVSIAKIMFWS